MIKKLISLSLALVMAAACVGCAKTESEEPDHVHASGFINRVGEATNLSIRYKDRESILVDNYDAAYTAVNNAFAVTLTKAMPSDYTGVFSPLSLQIALQILAMGEDEELSTELLNTICPGMQRSDIEANSAALIEKLTKSGGVTINSAVIVNTAYQVYEKFANSAADYYMASVGTMDFTDPAKALDQINGWIEENTDGLVRELLDSVDYNTAVVILNALTLKLNWKTPFTLQKNLISFTDNDGNASSATEMKLVTDLNYGKFDEGQMAILPYEGDEYAMAVILPAEGFTASEAACALMGRFGECSEMHLCVRMPKIELNDKIDILKIADKLHIDNALKGDFPEMIGSGVTISQVLQGAYLSVTESGTTAAAATAIVATKGLEYYEAEMVCDRPYAMVIYNVETGAVLFVSIVNTLAAEAAPASK